MAAAVRHLQELMGPAGSVGPFSIGKTQEEEPGREGFEPRRCQESAGRFGPFSLSERQSS
jgi:hypothetical protein